MATAGGERQEMLASLAADEAATLDRPVLLGAQQRWPVRLLATRVRAAARAAGHAVGAARLRRCGWTVLLTTVPAARLTLREALVLARARWQIELLFKLWKSHLRVDEWRSTNPWRIRTAVYAKLLAALVQHWLVLVGCWHHPDRSLVTAAQAIRAHAPHLAATFAAYPQLCQALQAVARSLATAGRLTKRQIAPSTSQLLLALDAAPFA